MFLGDSLTQHGFDVARQGFVGGVADLYQRRADVINRGYSGYNTSMILERIERILEDISEVDLVLICLGANDSALEDGGTNQYVPLDVFVSNLSALITRIAPTPIILLTPPDVDAERQPTRASSHTEKYADAVDSIAQEHNLPSVRLFDVIKSEQLYDGLHLNAHGNQAVFTALMTTIQEHYPALHPSNLEAHLPDWKDICSPTN